MPPEIPIYRREKPGILPALNRALKALLAAAFLALVIVLFLPEIRRQRDQAAVRDKLLAEKARQEEILARQTRQAELLKTDPAYLETLARDKLQVMKPGETIIRLDDEALPPVNPSE